MGFNRDDPDENIPFPDAWCDDCEVIRAAYGGWTEESEKLLKISLPCSGCYGRTCIRNTKTTYTLADMAALRWKCGSCEQWRMEPDWISDFGFQTPYYWSDRKGGSRVSSPPEPGNKLRKHFLSPDYCAIDDEHFFVRGVLGPPILGTAEHLGWGIWGSLSPLNFDTLLAMDHDPKRADLPPMFSWLSSRVPGYPETLSLKMYAHMQKTNARPHFELEEIDHPLSQEYHHGIGPKRVKEIMLPELRETS